MKRTKTILNKIVEIMKNTAKKEAYQRRIWLSAGIITFFAVFAAGCGGSAPAGGGPPGGPGGPGGRGAAAQEVSVEAITPRKISVQREVELAGSLIASDQARVSSEVAGIVRRVLVELGQEVAVGQVVVELDTRELELSLQRAESQLRQTEAQLGIDGVTVKEPPPDDQISSVRLAIANRDDAVAQLRRAERLRQQNLLPQADLDTAETRVKVTEANYRTALENVQSLKATLQDRRHAVEQAQKKLSDANIRASISGQISERLVNQGEFIRENTAVVSIVKLNPLKLLTSVQERYAGIVNAGLTVEFSVEAAPDRTFSARVAFVSPAVDTATRTFPIEVLVDNAHRLLKPGFFAKGVVRTHVDENVLAIPDDAISTLAGVSNVYIIEDGKIKRQPVTLGVRSGNLVEILNGLNGNEQLAASNLTMLAAGIPVNVIGTLHLPDEQGGSR
ncbi:MAG: efflux RND transporter periplasmic adaptor subunit [Acidobacteria bacterium]|nr:efflux RND transporter periplasmic adaptor subunit [Acidobacteriota bacterium]